MNENPSNSQDNAPPQQAFGSQTGTEGAPQWVSQGQYTKGLAASEELKKAALGTKSKARAFYTMLAIAGLLIATLYIGQLVAPYQFISRGNCVTGFSDIAFWLNPLAWIFVLFTGIIAVTMKKGSFILLGIIMIVISPIAWFLTGAKLILQTICGV